MLVASTALWYTLLVPLTSILTPVGYGARVAIVIVGLWFLGKRVLSRVFEHRLPLGATLLVLGISVVMTLNSIASADPEKFIDFVVFFGGIAGYFLIAERYPLNAKDIVVFVGIGLGASVLLVITGASGGEHEFDLLPFVGESWRVVVRGPHFTGRAGFFLLFATLLLSKQRGWSLRYVLLFTTAVYLIVFSGSRSSIAAALATLGLWYLRPVRHFAMKSRLVSLSIPVVAGLTMYLAPIVIFQSLTAEGFLGTLLKISPGQEDVTAGRLLTWVYHLDLFANNFWTGAPVSAVAESGENIPLELAGSNESFFTKILATQGVWGFLFYGGFLYLAWKSFRKRVYEAYILSVSFVVITSASGTFGSMYNFYSIIGYWGYFSLIIAHGKSRP
jgi:hypothetical protein